MNWVRMLQPKRWYAAACRPGFAISSADPSGDSVCVVRLEASRTSLRSPPAPRAPDEPSPHYSSHTDHPSTPDAAACAVLAVIYNAGAIGLAAEASSLRWDGVTGIGEREAAARRDAACRRAEAAATVPTVSRTQHLSSTVTFPAHSATFRPTDRRRITPSPTAAESAHQVMFYTFREVDGPAFLKRIGISMSRR